jgi:hypothetical protein
MYDRVSLRKLVRTMVFDTVYHLVYHHERHLPTLNLL